jgi:1-deoxy-D-xylulose-5-phosphate synthase
VFVGFGPIVARALEAADELAIDGWSVGVINARFAKPLDVGTILHAAGRARLVVTFEESVVTGGFGAGVLEAVETARIDDPALRAVPVRIIGIPGDAFVDHGSVSDLRRVLRLDSAGLAQQVRDTTAAIGLRPGAASPA